MRKHKTVRVRAGRHSAMIDRKIVPLIREIWRAGIDTVNSCEDNVPKGWVWVEFLTTLDAERFLGIVMPSAEDENWIRVAGLGDKRARPWQYQALPLDLNALGDPQTAEMTEFVFPLSIRFPRTDLGWVVTRLKLWNGGAFASTSEKKHARSA